MANASFPCSICEVTFTSPKDLGTHILQQHCEEATPKVTTKKEPEDVATIVETEKSIVMDVDPLAGNDTEDNNATNGDKLSDTQCLDDTILPVLPRAPTLDEQKQRFIMYNLPTDPSNFMR